MSKFYKFTDIANRTKPEPIYVRLDSIIGVFENHYVGGFSETVLNMAGGQHYKIDEPIGEVIKILEENA